MGAVTATASRVRPAALPRYKSQINRRSSLVVARVAKRTWGWRIRRIYPGDSLLVRATLAALNWVALRCEIMIDKSREQWLKDMQDYFKEVQSYNTTVMTVGYATFFGLLIFLQDKVKSPLVFWAGLFVAISAGTFVAYELVNQIKLALETRRVGKEGQLFFRYWAWFFIPSLMLAAVGVALLVYLFLCSLR